MIDKFIPLLINVIWSGTFIVIADKLIKSK
jgi:hypothetical protein